MIEHKFYDTETMYLHENRIWYTPMQVNGVACYDLLTNTNTYITCIEKEKEFRLFSKVFFFDDRLYYSPCKSNYILEVDVTTTITRKILVNTGEATYRSAFMYGSHMFLIQIRPVKRLLVVDVENETVKEAIAVQDFGDSSPNIVMRGEYAYVSFYDKTSILKFDCKTLTEEWISVPSSEEGYSTISFDGNQFWLSGKNSIIQWNENNGEIKVFPLSLNGFSKHNYYDMGAKHYGKSYLDDFPFWQSACLYDRVLFFPRCFNQIVQMNIETEALQEYRIDGESENDVTLLRTDRGTSGHYYCANQEEVLLLFSMASQFLYIINWEDSKITNRIQFKRDMTKEEILRNLMYGNKIYHEQNDGDFEKWVESINGYKIS